MLTEACAIIKKKEVCLMATNLNVAMTPKDSTFQVRINSEIKKTVEGLPFIVTKNSKEALKEQSIAMLMLDLKRAEERAESEDWIDAEDLEKELGVID